VRLEPEPGGGHNIGRKVIIEAPVGMTGAFSMEFYEEEIADSLKKE
jgi:hypothetical protein